MENLHTPHENETNQSRVELDAQKKEQKKKKIKKTIIITVSSIIFVLIISLFIFMWSIYSKIDDSIEVISIAPTIDEITQQPIVIPEQESVKNKALTVLLLGIDQRSGGGGLNTDVIILAAINPDTKKGAVISMPRDTRLEYTNDGKKEVHKANAYYALAYSEAQRNGASKVEATLAAKNVMKNAVGQLYDIPIQYAVSVNFKGFRDIVDTLGGLEIDVDMRMKYTDSHDGTDIDLYPGLQTLNGKQTLDFVRFRQTNDNPNASSDFERNSRQSQVINAIMKKMLSFGGISQINNVIEEVSDDVTTDMPSSEIRQLLTTYYNIKIDNITFTSLNGHWKNPYVYPDEQALEEAKSLLQSIIAE